MEALTESRFRAKYRNLPANVEAWRRRLCTALGVAPFTEMEECVALVERLNGGNER